MSLNKEKFYAGGFFYNPKTRVVFLHKRDDKATVNPNKWGFFGGLSEGEEVPKECFIREVKEELGIDIVFEEVKSLYHYFNEERGVWRYVFYVEKDLDESKLILGEGAGFGWIPLSEVFSYNLTDKTELDLRKFKDLNI